MERNPRANGIFLFGQKNMKLLAAPFMAGLLSLF